LTIYFIKISFMFLEPGETGGEVATVLLNV